jgi:hypothetical protein
MEKNKCSVLASEDTSGVVTGYTDAFRNDLLFLDAGPVWLLHYIHASTSAKPPQQPTPHPSPSSAELSKPP